MSDHDTNTGRYYTLSPEAKLYGQKRMNKALNNKDDRLHGHLNMCNN